MTAGTSPGVGPDRTEPGGGPDAAAALRRLPAVDQLLKAPAVAAAAQRLPRPLVVDAVRAAVAEARQRILAGAPPPDGPALAQRAAAHVHALRRRLLTPVINATGVVLHTNLGRAPLSRASIAAMEAVAAGYSNLEYEIETGRRGSRHVHGEALLTRLTGAEAAMVVNNNAAAVLLVLSALAHGREVIISRGEMIEIGGAFRIPEVMAQSGCLLREVGTTNRTHRRDYEQAIGPQTAAILKVHPSNYRVVGFTASVSTRELAALARRHGLLLIEDLGSGVLLPTEGYGLAHEPTVQETVAAGADLVTFSGDKLLGGPQAGIIVGRRDLVERCRRHPLARAVRVDKLTLAALQATLQHYLDGTVEEIPVYRMLARAPAELARRAEAVRDRVLAQLAAGSGPAGHGSAPNAGEGGAAGKFEVQVVSTTSTVGGGSLPGEGQPSAAVAVTVRDQAPGGAIAALAAALRRQEPPIVGRIEDDMLLLDLRAVDPGQDQQLAEGLARALEAMACTS
ncbi:MAG TPA: L-seryl-tRNA(Sec) selenium transferase [Limnochordales bacterium]|nr:L-seryl-tRNA(Sec) selenium transferase [Limnochordales bacterium]